MHRQYQWRQELFGRPGDADAGIQGSDLRLPTHFKRQETAAYVF
jgi:hypothetical protein